MPISDPKDVIVAYVSTPSITLDEAPAPDTLGWRMQTGTGGLGAKIETIRLVKERHIPHRQLHYITFEDEARFQMNFTCLVIEDNSGVWKVWGAAGGATGRIQRPEPWANLGGGWGNQFYAGGRVENNGLEIVRARLRSANGIVMEDNAENNIVLFLDDRYIATPLQAELYDRKGALVGTHQVFRA